MRMLRTAVVPLITTASLLLGSALVPMEAGAKKPVMSWKASALDHSSSYGVKDLVKTKSKGKRKLSATGDCSISSGTLSTSASGTCTVTVKLAAKGRYKKAKLTKAFTLLECSTGGHCEVGDTGPGGGKVFYVAVAAQSWGTYLEAAPSDLAGSAIWGCPGVSVTTGGGLGDGRANSVAISTDCNDNTSAAAQAVASTVGGKSDWAVPSSYELALMYNQKTMLGMDAGAYWTSTQYSTGYGYFTAFVNGNSASYGKDQGMAVRFMRAF